jgi:hypothetical protein
LKTFEDCFSELQADMVSGCLDYAEENKAKGASVDNIYIHCFYEKIEKNTGIEGIFEFRINGRITHSHMPVLNDDMTVTYIPGEKQQAVLALLTDKIKEIMAVCKKYDKPMPTEMKLTYDVKNGSLDAAYQYGPIINGTKSITFWKVAKNWFAKLEADTFKKEQRLYNKTTKNAGLDASLLIGDWENNDGNGITFFEDGKWAWIGKGGYIYKGTWTPQEDNTILFTFTHKIDTAGGHYSGVPSLDEVNLKHTATYTCKILTDTIMKFVKNKSLKKEIFWTKRKKTK